MIEPIGAYHDIAALKEFLAIEHCAVAQQPGRLRLADMIMDIVLMHGDNGRSFLALR